MSDLYTVNLLVYAFGGSNPPPTTIHGPRRQSGFSFYPHLVMPPPEMVEYPRPTRTMNVIGRTEDLKPNRE